MIKVAVLGSTGMLGHVVSKQLELDERFSVRRFCRNPQREESFVDAFCTNDVSKLDEFDYVINCIGLIKQLKNVKRRDWFAVNTVFPWQLASQCERQGSKLIHISTDCVYDGLTGNYSESSYHDAEDDYGLSKSLGEPSTKAMVLRTSVIGPEKRGRLSLLEWALSRREQTVEGYINHTWNGLTSFEYANVCKKIILNDLYSRGVFHVFSNEVSKYDLLTMFNDAYKLDLKIKKVKANVACHRTLCSTKPLNAMLDIPSVQEMVIKMSSLSD